MAWILNLLKVVGLLIVSISSWVGTASVTRDSNKHLTRAGKWLLTLTVVGFGISVVSQLIDSYNDSASQLEVSRDNQTMLRQLGTTVKNMEKVVTRFNSIAVSGEVQLNIDQPGLKSAGDFQQRLKDLFDDRYHQAKALEKKDPSLGSGSSPLHAVFNELYDPSHFPDDNQKTIREYVEHIGFYVDFYRDSFPQDKLDPRLAVGKSGLCLRAITQSDQHPGLKFDFNNRILSVEVSRAEAEFNSWDSTDVISSLHDLPGAQIFIYPMANLGPPYTMPEEDLELVLKINSMTKISNASVRFDSKEIPLMPCRAIAVSGPVSGSGVMHAFIKEDFARVTQ
jgi:hypothetical protein